MRDNKCKGEDGRIRGLSMDKGLKSSLHDGLVHWVLPKLFLYFVAVRDNQCGETRSGVLKQTRPSQGK